VYGRICGGGDDSGHEKSGRARLNGGLTLITLLLRGAQFVDGIYGPEDVTSADMGLSAAEQRDPG